MAARKYFGTDGIRGYVGEPPITPDFLARLGFAAGRALASRGAHNAVLIGKDTRLSGYMVESALEAGLAAAGFDVLLTGPLPTSAVSYLTPTLRLRAGIVVSASHNPHHDNGIKFFGADGRKLPDKSERAIERALTDAPLRFAGAPGRARRLDAAADRYIEFCKRAFPAGLNLRGMRVVVDGANGAAYHAAPALFHELGADVTSIGDAPDGVNINVGCGALAPAAAMQKTTEAGADIGVVLDGDADRALLVDERGRLWNGDALLYLMARAGARRGRRPAGVVGTLLSNLALEQKLTAMKIPFARADVGDRNVDALLEARGWSMGGEPSGHILLREFHQTGDGIIAALQALREMRETGKPLSALLAQYEPLPQATRDIAIANHRRILSRPRVARALARLRAGMGKGARLVVRPSGTEPLVRVMAEGDNPDKMQAALNQVEETLRAK